MLYRYLFALMFFCMAQPLWVHASEASRQVYQQAVQLAVQDKSDQAIVALQAASAVLPMRDAWKTRMQTAAILLQLKGQQSTQLPSDLGNEYLLLAAAYAQSRPQPEVTQTWPVGLLAALLPGAGHAWLGRWHDAGVAAAFVWPLLILTLWAARRHMGPVTVFFALLTVWFWSGTVFSAVSLAERGSFELYLSWWQGLWQASGLPSRPW